MKKLKANKRTQKYIILNSTANCEKYASDAAAFLAAQKAHESIIFVEKFMSEKGKKASMKGFG